MKKQTKIPITEAALRRGIKLLGYDPILAIHKNPAGGGYYLYNYAEDSMVEEIENVIWRGRLSDIYKKRKPLKGVVKKLKKAIK